MRSLLRDDTVQGFVVAGTGLGDVLGIGLDMGSYSTGQVWDNYPHDFFSCQVACRLLFIVW